MCVYVCAYLFFKQCAKKCMYIIHIIVDVKHGTRGHKP